MTKPKANHRYLASMLLVFLLLITSSARPLSDPTVNLALPSDRVVLPETPGRVSTCTHMRVAGKQPFPVTKLAGGKHVSLVLNMLPKGPVPPSAPSKGINNLNN
ncbi:hypothetical protein V8G54_006926 [Vigna mungo]|uniref:Uncharacterized protein n=1 Tax=Vigna mungo TaxID=3915 RepID=A0AAQ3P0S0_VIGMU